MCTLQVARTQPSSTLLDRRDRLDIWRSDDSASPALKTWYSNGRRRRDDLNRLAISDAVDGAESMDIDDSDEMDTLDASDHALRSKLYACDSVFRDALPPPSIARDTQPSRIEFADDIRGGVIGR